jgi:hypothetical protein
MASRQSLVHHMTTDSSPSSKHGEPHFGIVTQACSAWLAGSQSSRVAQDSCELRTGPSPNLRRLEIRSREQLCLPA